ncbi:MAG: hypothetical protein WCJ46_03725 [bacterium]
MKKILFLLLGCVLLGGLVTGSAKPAPTPEEDEIISNLEMLQNFDVLVQLDFFEKYDTLPTKEDKEKPKGEKP